MSSKPYLIFSLNTSLYGIEAQWVEEIFSLPEVTPIAEAPRDIIGVVNLRGDILPIVDLNLRFGYRQLDYSLSDSIIVLQWQKNRVGMIVNQVIEVHNISLKDTTKELFTGQEITGKPQHFVAGVAKLGVDIVMLLNQETLLLYSESVTALAKHSLELNEEKSINSDSFNKQLHVFCPDATSEEKASFRERARNLMRPTEKQDFAGLIPLAVVGLNGEYFGIDVHLVREFTDIRKVTPVPCCPPHIIGNMNLRGEIITLVDIRALLNMPMIVEEKTLKVTLVSLDDLVAGIVVDEVFDVMYLNRSEMSSLPAAVNSMKDEYLQSTAPYREKMMSLLDLAKILKNGELIVNEEV